MNIIKNSIIPFLCLTASVLVLYGRIWIPHERPELPASTRLSKQAAQRVITIHYHERPPYYSTGVLGVYGLCSDPAKKAFKQAKIAFRWEKTPANRQLEILKANKSRDCLIGWFKNPEREKFAKFSHFIYRDRPAIALTRADNHRMQSGGTLEDMFLKKTVTLLKKDGYSYGRFIDSKIADLNPGHIITNADNTGMLKMIHSLRADYFFISEEEAMVLTASSGLLKTDFKFVRFTDMPEGNKRYLLFSKNVDDRIIEKINAAIKIQLYSTMGT